MNKLNIYRITSFCIGGIWLINGLFCKVMNIVPRHQEIVAAILGREFSRPLTFAIGMAEAGMAIWIFSGKKSRLSAVIQIVIITAMNILEFILVPDLLLWGKANAIFAFLLIIIIAFNEFYLNRKTTLVN